MIWYLLAVASPSFVLGFGVCQALYTKRIAKMLLNLPSEFELSARRYEIYMEGWNAANANTENVKLQYDKLISPLKYEPKEK